MLRSGGAGKVHSSGDSPRQRRAPTGNAVIKTAVRPLEGWLDCLWGCCVVSESGDWKCLFASLGVGSVPREQGLGATFSVLRGTWGILEELQAGLGAGSAVGSRKLLQKRQPAVPAARQGCGQKSYQRWASIAEVLDGSFRFLPFQTGSATWPAVGG